MQSRGNEEEKEMHDMSHVSVVTVGDSSQQDTTGDSMWNSMIEG